MHSTSFGSGLSITLNQIMTSLLQTAISTFFFSAHLFLNQLNSRILTLQMCELSHQVSAMPIILMRISNSFACYRVSLSS